MRQEDYKVRLDMFQGPMDLLLYLIQRAEVDIAEIPLAKITDQYLAFLRQIDDVDVELAGEFLVMAATLIEIKSRSLAPPAKAGEEGESGDDGASALAGLGTGEGGGGADPGFELIQQLLAYQRFRIAAEELDTRRRDFQKRFPSRPGRREPTDKLGDHRIEMDDTPVALYQTDLLDRLTRAADRRMTLQEAFTGSNQAQRIGLFLATLELVRLRRITVIQEDIYSDIELAMIGEGENGNGPLVIETDEISIADAGDSTGADEIEG